MASFLVVILLAGMIQSSAAQLSLPDFGQTSGSNPPAEVTRLGSIEVAPVRSPISGKELFVVASPTVVDRNAEGADLTAAVEERAGEVNARLRRAMLDRQEPPMDADSLAVDVAVLNGVTVITARDAHYTQPLILVSTTQIDTSYHGLPIDELARQWRDILDTEIRAGLGELSSEFVLQDLASVGRILLVLVALTVGVALVQHLLGLRQQRLRQRKDELQARAEPESPQTSMDPQAGVEAVERDERIDQQREAFLQGLDEVASLDRRLSMLSFLQWLLFWSLILLWYFGLYQLVKQFPVLEKYSRGVLEIPIRLLLIWFFTGFLIRICRRLIDRLTSVKDGGSLLDVLTAGDSKRLQLRASTIAGAAKGFVTILIAGFGILLALGALGLPTGSVLAIGGIFGLAISFGSQNLVRDLVNGVLILSEDQYAIGDVVDTGTAAGLVENLNLRVTQLRSVDGELITIPNSNITQVRNLTRNWSRVAFSITVAYETDPDKALRVLTDVGLQLYDDPDWHERIVSEPTVLGIDTISHTGITITTWIQTEPAQQWAIGREFRLRVRRAFAEHGIDIGTPRQTYRLEPPRPEPASA
ncbi:mechanosensitive ion channel family protein [Synechococcus sp. CCY9201]|uniref:mechanosensitive ion channel family protein n=1 Tax=unclassified Synechococcus TaxID=2626047 RepID=UPI002AD26F11|nr:MULTISPECIES: mechanosensitive ion channel family protein [unclassified Synechococcus]MEA5473623.1 mechanosensitive ion channel family protein [Synechococcus sp. CCY9201]